MPSPAPPIPHGEPHQNGYFKGRTSPERSAQVVAEAKVRRSRSGLLTIGWVLLAVLVVGAAAAMLAISTGTVISSATALVVIASTVLVVVVALVCALVVVRKALAAEGDNSPQAGAETSDDNHEQRPATQSSNESGRPEPAEGPWESEQPGVEQNNEVFSRIASRLQAKVARAFVDLDTQIGRAHV